MQTSITASSQAQARRSREAFCCTFYRKNGKIITISKNKHNKLHENWWKYE